MISRVFFQSISRTAIRIGACFALCGYGVKADTVAIPYYYLPVTFYDYHGDGSNPEFECGSTFPHSGTVWTTLVPGMVDTVLDANKKPIKNANISSTYLVDHIGKWFRPWQPGDSITMVIPASQTIGNCRPDSSRIDTLILDPDTIFQFPFRKCDTIQIPASSYKTDTAFANVAVPDSLKFSLTGTLYRNGLFQDAREWPMDGKGFIDEVSSTGHNSSYAMEMHNRFVYHGGDTLRIATDDDCWVFINGRLRIDAGGLHGSVPLGLRIDSFGLTPGDTYDFDLFYAERSVGGCFSMESNLDFITRISVGADTVVKVAGRFAPGRNDMFRIAFNGNSLHFSRPGGADRLRIAVYTVRGQLAGVIMLGRDAGGVADIAARMGLSKGIYLTDATAFQSRTAVARQSVMFVIK